MTHARRLKEPGPPSGTGETPPASGTILVVEDERIVARDLQQRLKKLGFAVPEIACSGEEALKLAEQIRPQLILMDIKLKGSVNGLETARRIGEQLKIPVMFLSAYDDEETLSASRSMNAVDCLSKPYEDRRLFGAINDFFSRSAGSRKP